MARFDALGDHKTVPNPNLRALERTPFYAVKMVLSVSAPAAACGPTTAPGCDPKTAV